jgi:predicted O-methyltransferase YrrM
MRTFQRFVTGHIDDVGAPVIEKLWPLRPAWAVASISERDAAFFAGLVIETRPAKLLEIGVASGWGSCVLLEALRSAGLPSSELYGVDIAERFFYDAHYATGQCVSDVLPECRPRYHLTTGTSVGECAPTIGDAIDFVFIDAHHMHPWATLDLLAVLPFVEPGTWIAMHDLNLSRKEDQEHRNRGPKYLFEGWDHDKIHSTEEPTMAGAILTCDDAASHLPLLLDILYTPWEIAIEQTVSEAVCSIIAHAYGETWAARFRRAIEIGNYHVGKLHSPDIDRLREEIAALRSGGGRWIRRIFAGRNA